MRRLPALVALSLLPLAACTDLAGEDDPIDGAFGDGKSDSAVLREGSPEAVGVLALVNEASEDFLREEVGITRRAAGMIADERTGDDFELGTADDQIIWSLRHLDEILYVGQATLNKLAAYAQAHGYVTERRWSAFYSFGDGAVVSSVYLFDDGTGYREEVTAAAPGELVRTKLELAPEQMAALAEAIEGAGEGRLAKVELEGGANFARHAQGGLWVYPADGREVPVIADEVEFGDTNVTHNWTRNQADAARTVEAIMLELVANDIAWPVAPLE